MRTCPYCGAEYLDEVTECPVDRTSLVVPVVSPAADVPKASDQPRPRYEFTPMSPADAGMDWVTLLRCENLGSADLVVSRLEASGISAFIPDENLMQVIGFNLNTFGYVRVQVSPEDYERAKGVLEEQASDMR